jgi:Ca2+-binding EF-hand superfamily protein
MSQPSPSNKSHEAEKERHTELLKEPLGSWSVDSVTKASFELVGLTSWLAEFNGMRTASVRRVASAQYEIEVKDKDMILTLKETNLMNPKFERKVVKRVDDGKNKKHRIDFSTRTAFTSISQRCRLAVKQGMKEHGCTWEEALQKVFLEFDSSNDGSIDQEEFMVAVCSLIPAVDQQQVKAVFDVLDCRRTGLIDLEYFGNVLRKDDRTQQRKQSDIWNLRGLSSNWSETQLPIQQRAEFRGNIVLCGVRRRNERIKERSHGSNERNKERSHELRSSNTLTPLARSPIKALDPLNQGFANSSLNASSLLSSTPSMMRLSLPSPTLDTVTGLPGQFGSYNSQCFSDSQNPSAYTAKPPKRIQGGHALDMVERLYTAETFTSSLNRMRIRNRLDSKRQQYSRWGPTLEKARRTMTSLGEGRARPKVSKARRHSQMTK